MTILFQRALTRESKVKKDKLDSAIVAYHKHRKGDNLSKSTERLEASILTKLLTSVGNIYTENLTGDHVDEFMDTLWETNGARSMANYFYMTKNFFGWLHETERIRRNPMSRRKAPKFTVEERRRVNADQFALLLDQARNPIERMVMASGLYLLSRDKEITNIRIGDLLWDIKRVRTMVAKQKGRKAKSTDDMPMTLEYQRELARFLAWYEDQCGPLQPHWYLHPTLTRPTFEPAQDGNGNVRRQYVNPLKAGIHHNRMVQEALEAIGFPTRRDDGTSANEGMHTLRRSGARARFNELRHMGYDGALREVQMLLHHAHGSMTEHYIGIDLDTLKRDEALIDKPMYPSLLTGDEKPIDLSVFLPGTAVAANKDDVIDLASRRRTSKPQTIEGEEDIVYPSLRDHGYPGGRNADGTVRRGFSVVK